MRPWPLKDILSVAIVTILLASLLWVKFTVLPWWLIAALFVFLVYLSKAWGLPSLQKPVSLQQLPKDTSSILSRVLWGCFFCAPVFVYLFLTWNQDFPYFGDQEYHLLAFRIANTFWPAHWMAPTLILLVICGGLLSRWRVNLCWLAVPLFLFLAQKMHSVDINFAIRYPALIYLLEIPFVRLFDVLMDDHFLPAVRFLNALSVPVWLFVLRPFFVSRWPDIRALPFVAFFFFQKDVVYYFTSGYLEPWPLMLLILAVECVLVRGREELWIASLLLLVAAFMKDQFIFALPLPLLAALPFRRLVRNTPLLMASAGSALAVSCYWLMRFAWFTDIRRYEVLPRSYLFSAEHFQRWGGSVLLQWGTGLPVLMCAVVLLFVIAIRVRRNGWAPAAVLGMAFGLFLAFFLDFNEPIAPGYPRFTILTWAVCGAGFLLIGHVWKQRRAVLVSLIILVLNGIPLGAELVKATEPDPARNFLEHPTCSGFFPIRTLVEQGEREGLLTKVTQLRMVFHLVPTFNFTQPPSFSMLYGYGDLVKNYAVRFDTDLETDLEQLQQCTCSAPGEAAVFLPLYLTNMRALTPERAHVEETAERCVTQLRETCSRTTEVTLHGQTIGLLGVD